MTLLSSNFKTCRSSQLYAWIPPARWSVKVLVFSTTTRGTRGTRGTCSTTASNPILIVNIASKVQPNISKKEDRSIFLRQSKIFGVGWMVAGSVNADPCKLGSVRFKADFEGLDHSLTALQRSVCHCGNVLGSFLSFTRVRALNGREKKLWIFDTIGRVQIACLLKVELLLPPLD